jgi:hypothetical protein
MSHTVFDEMPLNSGEEEIALFSGGYSDYSVFDEMPLGEMQIVSSTVQGQWCWILLVVSCFIPAKKALPPSYK